MIVDVLTEPEMEDKEGHREELDIIGRGQREYET